MEKAFAAKLLEGDTQTLQWIYDNLGPSIFGFVLKNGGSKEDAEDIFQTTITDVYINLSNDKYNEQNKFRHYFIKIAMNKWRKEQQRRTKMNKQPIDDYISSLEDESIDNLSKVIIKNKKIDAIERAFSMLNESCKELIKAKYFYKIKLKDIAQDREEKSSTIRVQLMRCRERIIKSIRNIQYYN